MLYEAVMEVMQDLWKGAYVEVSGSDVSKNANIIGLHVLCKTKSEEKGNKSMKARLCYEKNRDCVKGNIRSDSANAQFDMIRLIL